MFGYASQTYGISSIQHIQSANEQSTKKKNEKQENNDTAKGILDRHVYVNVSGHRKMQSHTVILKITKKSLTHVLVFLQSLLECIFDLSLSHAVFKMKPGSAGL